MTFRHYGITGRYTHTVTDSATVDTGSLTLGTSGHPLDLSVGTFLNVWNGGQLNIFFDSDVTTFFLRVGLIPGAAADVTVNGVGSTLNASASTSLGGSGSTGTLVFENGSTGNSLAGSVNLPAKLTAGSTGVLEVLSGSTVSTGAIRAGAEGVAGQSGTISVEDPNSVLTQTGSSTLTLGAAANSTGLLQLTGGGTFTTGTGTVTVNPTGRIEIDGGTLNCNGLLDIDGGQLEQISGSLVMPSGGQITVQYGGDVIYDDTYRIDDGNTVTVTGLGSTWHSDALLYVGDDSTGTLNLTSEANLTANGIVYVGRDGTGTLNLASSADLTANNSLYVGYNGTGTLNLASGADLTVSSVVYIGRNVGANGTVLMDGSDTDFYTAGSVYVGGSSSTAGGNATFTVSNDAELHVPDTLKIYDTANFTLDWGRVNANIVELAPGASFNATERMGILFTNTLVGFGDNIDLDCFLYIGTYVGGTGGSHTVGAGQSLDVRRHFSIGWAAPGTLIVSDGGDVTNGGSAYIGLNGSANGSSVSINGTESTWSIWSILYVGVWGDATLDIEAGGTVSTGVNGYIALEATSIGQVNVTGTSSTLSIGDDLYVGGSASGTGGDGMLVVSSGGKVEVENTLKVWDTGTLQLDSGTPGGSIYCDTLELDTGGTFDFLGGKLHVATFNGNLLNQGGTLAPGTSAGLTTINGSYTQQTGAALEIEIGGTTPGVDYDRVDVNGLVSLGGDLELYIIDGFPPASSDTFTVLDAGTILNEFDNVSQDQRLTTLDGIGSFLVHYNLGFGNPNQIVLSDFTRTYSADFDYDGDVDGDDLTKWQDNYGLTGDADADGDGDSDGLDFLTWQRQFGSGVMPLASTSTQVPEPATWLLLLSAAGYLITTRRK